MKLRKLALAALALLAASGCSLVKLSDDIKQENCDSDTDCEVLNDRKAKDFDPCDLWQCRPATKLCEKFALDQDHDGFTPATTEDDIMCEVAAEKQDCDDGSDARKPGGKESCDDVDNDCDQSVDEGALLPKENVAVAFSGTNLDGAGDVAYAVDPGTGDVAIAYSINRSPNNVLGFSVLKNDAPMGATAAAVAPPSKRLLFADTAGVASLGAGKFAVAFFNGSGQRLVAGVIDGNGSGERDFVATEDVMANGLRCGDGEEGMCTTGTPDTQTPGLAALGSDVLVAYVRAASDPSQTCHAKSDSVPAHKLLANLLIAQTDGLTERTDEAVLIAESSALEAPAVIGIASSAGEAAFGWLIAYVDEGGAIVVRRVEADGTTLKVSSPLFTLNDASHRHSHLRFTLGPKGDDGQVVGLAFQRGCTVAARVGAVLLRASLDGSTAKVQQLGAPILVGGAANETRPAIAYAKDRKVWGVAYRDPSGLRARFIDEERKLLGADPYELLATVKSGSDKRELLLSPALVPSHDGGWFFALSYAQRTGATPQVIEAATLASCSKKD